jgi:hypothetical protein
MNELVTFLSELTGKAIDVAPQAIAGLVALKAASIALWTTVMWWCAAGTVVFFVLTALMMNEDSVGFALIFGLLGAVCFCSAICGLIEGPLTAPVFNVAPEAYVIRALL